MTDIASFRRQVGAALGLRERVADWTARELQHAGLLGADDAATLPMDAATFLVAASGALGLEHPAKVIETYSELPVFSVTESALDENGVATGWLHEDDSPFVQNAIRTGGFLGFLGEIIDIYANVEGQGFALAPAGVSFCRLGFFPVATIDFAATPAACEVAGPRALSMMFADPGVAEHGDTAMVQSHRAGFQVFDAVQHALAGVPLREIRPGLRPVPDIADQTELN